MTRSVPDSVLPLTTGRSARAELVLDSDFTRLLCVAVLVMCLSCATPFPFEKLEEDLTVETVLEELGPPKAIKSGNPGANWCYAHEEQAWCYTHEEQAWPETILFSSVFLPYCVVASAITLPLLGNFACTPIDETEVVLHFREEGLVRWDTRERRGYYVPPQYEYCYGGICTDSRGDALWKNEKVQRTKRGTGIWVWVDKPPCTWERACDDPCHLVHIQRTQDLVRPGDHLYVNRNNVSIGLEPAAPSETRWPRWPVDHGQRITLLGKRRQWCQVEDDLGTTGWIACVFLESDAP